MPSRAINQNWAFGQGAALSVTGGGSTTGSSAIDTREGCASISDSTGQLVLYTDGVTVWDRYGIVQVPPGTPGLHGHDSSTQSAVVVPDPGDPNQYYIFTTAGYTSGAAFHHFDGVRVRVTGGTWPAAIPLASIMPPLPQSLTDDFSSTEKLTALWHRDCVDIWVITIVTKIAPPHPTPPGNPNAQNGPGYFRIFRVTPAGVQYVADTPINVDVYDLGYLKANRSGSRLAFANADKREVWVYNFNNASGAVDLTSPVHIGLPHIPGVDPQHPLHTYGVEFSPSGDILYYSLIGKGNTGTSPDNNGYICQVQLGTSTTPAPSLIQTYSNPTSGLGADYAIGALQLGNDDRIYIAKDKETTLGAILNPDSMLPTVNMNFVALPPGTTCQLGLPNFVTSLCDCHCPPGCLGFAGRMFDRMRLWRRPNGGNRQ